MKTNNTKNFFIFINLLTLISLASCSFREKQINNPSTGNSSFIVEEITKSNNNNPIVVTIEKGISTKFIVSLKTCIKDAITPDVSIQKAPFVIEYKTRNDKGTTTNKIEKTSDTNGCIQWQEEYKYRYINHPVWIQLTRTIKTEASAYQGQVHVRMAINPWLTDSDQTQPAILDLRHSTKNSYEENGLSFLHQKDDNEKAQLWAENISVQMKVLPSNDKPRRQILEQTDLELFTKQLLIIFKSYEVEEIKNLLKEFELECVKDKKSKLCESSSNRLLEILSNKCTKDKEPVSCEKEIKNTVTEIFPKLLQKQTLDSKDKNIEYFFKDGSVEYFSKKLLIIFKSYEEMIKELLKKFGLGCVKNKESNSCESSSNSLLETLSKKCTKDKELVSCEKEIKNTLIEFYLKPYQNSCEHSTGENKWCYKRFIRLNLLIPLEVKRYNVTGKVITEPLTGGTYDINTQLILIPLEEETSYRLHHKICENKDIDLNTEHNQKLSVECFLEVSHFNKNATYKIAVEITPKNTEMNLKKFDGLYTIGLDFSGSKNDVSIDNELSNQYKRDSFKQVVDYLSNIQNISAGSSTYVPDLYAKTEFKFANIRSSKNCEQNENTVTRIANFTGKVCLLDKLNGKKYEQTPFRVFIEKSTGTIEEIFFEDNKKFSTTTEGCLHISIPIEHNIFDRQKYFIVNFHILSEELHLYGKGIGYFNPWQRAFQAHQDGTALPKGSLRTDTEGVKKPKLVINQFKSVNLFPSYGLDKLLNINLFHRIYLLFQPFILRPDNVGFGLNHRARELLRDGLYLVRFLILRNPQETQVLTRVELLKNLRQQTDADTNLVLQEEFEKLKYDYFTHVDTLVKAEGNFLNVYIPLEISTKQLYYVASRNLLVLEVIPADPSGFKYKESAGDAVCEIDVEESNFKPFLDHDLENSPYMGAFNLQSWTNWNILKEININTDAIINESKLGRDKKKFSLSAEDSQQKVSAEDSQQGLVNQACANIEDNLTYFNKDETASNYYAHTVIAATEMGEVPKQQIVYQDQMDECTSNKYAPISEEILKENEKPLKKAQDLLKDFAYKNFLKILDLSVTESGNKFTNELSKAFDKVIKSIKEESYLTELQPFRNLFSERLLETKTNSFVKYNQQCAYKDDIETMLRNQTLSTNEVNKKLQDFPFCTYKEVMNSIRSEHIYRQKIGRFRNSNTAPQPFESEVDRVIKTLIKDLKENPSDRASQSVVGQTEKFLSIYLDTIKLDTIKGKHQINHKSIQNLINDRSFNHVNLDEIENQILAKSFCYYWFDSYLKELGKTEMLSAYTDFISKFDYYKILEKHISTEFTFDDFMKYEANIFFDFMKEQNTKEEEEEEEEEEEDPQINQCHNAYTSCIYSDHCALNKLNDGKKSYCTGDNPIVIIEQDTCTNLLQNECTDQDDNRNLCKTGTPCTDRVNNFCTTNPDNPLCDKFESRCLRTYSSCLKEKIPAEFFKPETILNFDFINKKKDGWFSSKKTTPLDVCLKNPTSFFKFENKMLIHELSEENPEYKGGYASSFSATGNFSNGSYKNWTGQSGSDISYGASAGFSLPKFFTSLGISLSTNHKISSNRSKSLRRSADARTGEAAFMVIARTTIGITVKKYQKCLIVKPRFSSFFKYQQDDTFKPFDESLWKKGSNSKTSDFKKLFISRPGLIICNPIAAENPEEITEDYYYITQGLADPSTSHFLNLYDLANRPFSNILRGRTEYLKFFSMYKKAIGGNNGDIDGNTDSYNAPADISKTYPHIVEEAVALSLQIRKSSDTGFHPGIYNYSEDSDQELEDIFKPSNRTDKIMNTAEGYNVWQVPRNSDQNIH